MAKAAAPHNGMQTVTFTCAKGDTFRAHGHTAHGAHHHEVRRLRDSTKKGCPVLKLQPGVVHRLSEKDRKNGRKRLGVKCGAKVTEDTVNHETPERVEASADRTGPFEAAAD